ncbi:type VI secretion system baseplate subunit TssF [Morganella morganii]|uniref:type VI secretion system baseplate subunit TssF n=1 Tax=Morganella morganii TaxID=582 RepID=UPI00164C3972|nr:type VI secretion system baseplate subunit TssF [Morganella morganii]
MHDSTLYYFERQRQLLLDGLDAFRCQHPHQAQLLGISGQTITDPQLRALLDGVAYLTGLTAQQQALIAPQLTETLVHTVFPDYRRPVPALLPVLFTPQTTAQTQILAADTPFTTHTAAGKTIHWRTQHPLTLMPVAITAQQFTPQAAVYTEQGESRTAACSLQLTFSVTVPGVSLSELNLTSLTLHFTGDGELPWLTDDAVHRQCATIRLNAGETEIFLSPDACQRLPLTYRAEAEDDVQVLLYDALWYPEQAAGALISLADLLRHCNGQTFTLTFFFRDMLPHPVRFARQDSIALFRTVLTNCFAYQSEPLRVPPGSNPHPVCADTQSDVILHSAEAVTDITALPAQPVPQLYHQAATQRSACCWQPVCGTAGEVTHLNCLSSGEEAEPEHVRLWVVHGRGTQGERAVAAAGETVTPQQADPLMYHAVAAQRAMRLPLPLQPDPCALFLRLRQSRLSDLTDSPEALKALLSLYDRQNSPVISGLITAVEAITSSPGVTVRFYHHLPLTIAGQHITVTLAQHTPAAGTAFFAALLEAVFTALSDGHEFIQLTLRRRNDNGALYHGPLRTADEPF